VLTEHETAYAEVYLDPELNHSSAYFLPGETSLARAQRAKIDAILTRCDVRPGMRLLDVGCGWGAAARVAAAGYGAEVVGLTISAEQYRYAVSRQRQAPGPGPVIDYRLHGWEHFGEPVDRIISINSFENFANKRDFLPHCRKLLTAGGMMTVLAVTADRPMFRVVSKREIIAGGEDAGFGVRVSGSLAPHYVRTLEHFVGNLRGRREQAEAVVGSARVDRHISYYSRCADFLRSGLNDMFEFTFLAGGS
jgi:cyclopropane-fatty-acyl-phospholipid synthase